MRKLEYHVTMLTDENFDKFRQFINNHFEERAIPLYKAIGIEINNHSFNKDSEFYQDMWTTWQIARGEKKVVFPNKGYENLVSDPRLKSRACKIKSVTDQTTNRRY